MSAFVHRVHRHMFEKTAPPSAARPAILAALVAAVMKSKSHVKSSISES
ncbi:MAG: hypothetical protein WDN44_15565 [Sphingomonas sp.]